jgi:NAD(P)-dependent dehydrogenase (short-subunit alcohol dehydrogenase family)/acyl carrier protein
LKRGIDTLGVSERLAQVAAIAASNPVALRSALERAGVRSDDVLASLITSASALDLTKGTCLITGGLAGLGLVTAEWLVARGARSVALLARSEPGAQARAAIERMRSAGATVSVFRGDVSSPDDVARVLAAIRATMAPLNGVVHAAGVLDDAVLANMTPEQHRRVLAPKVDGAWLLHQGTLHDSIDYFVLYSSVLAYLGAAGQANHAVANAFLDALAHHRRGAGLPAISINWGVWSTIGSAAHDGRGDRLASMGLAAISPEEGCAALERLLTSNPAQGSVMRFSPERWREHLPGAARSTLFRAFTTAAASAATSTANATPAEPPIAERLAAASVAERRQIVERFVAARAARVLRLPAAQIDLDKPLRAMGLDSLLAVEFRNRLEADAGVPVPTTLIWNYPTIAKLAPQIAARLGASLDAPEPAAASADADLDALLGELESLSDEDARRALLQDGRVADV